jgi:protein ImuB
MSRIVSVFLPRWPILRFLAAQARQARRHDLGLARSDDLSRHERGALPLPEGERAGVRGYRSQHGSRDQLPLTRLEPPNSDKHEFGWGEVRDLIDPQRPFVLTVEGAGGPRIIALNEAAETEGLVVGESLADARAKATVLQVREADPAADAAALRRLALWATRYTPTASPWGTENGADGFFLDVAGSAHLFGGEAALLAELADRLARFGLPARLAVADTPGASWALARFHAQPCIVLPSGEEPQAIAPLPVETLRLSPDSVAALRRLGFKRVGALLREPRAPFAARFASQLLLRLDQALGRASEPLVPVLPPPVYHSLRYLIEPIVTQEAVVAVACRLMTSIVPVLVRDGVGARALRLALYRVDGAVRTLDIGLSRPTRNPTHVVRLIELKLEALVETIDAGFGFEAVGLAVTTAEPIVNRQMEFTRQAQSRTDGCTTDLNADPDPDRAERCASLIDVLAQRLGPRRVRRLAPVESHLPERAETLCTAATPAAAWPTSEMTQPRPLLLFPRPEPVENVMAEVPDGPPQRFRWRGEMHHIRRAQGPERIASEWWRKRTPRPTRDYYLVEDTDGHRFWLCREGLYEHETSSARWFVHGLFA